MDAGEKRLAREINAIQSIHSLAPNMNGLYYKLIWMIDYKGFRIEASVSPPVKSEASRSLLTMPLATPHSLAPFVSL